MNEGQLILLVMLIVASTLINMGHTEDIVDDAVKKINKKNKP